ncbi:MAG: LamG domain-containing protein, partial [Elusimicrobiota bacterium]
MKSALRNTLLLLAGLLAFLPARAGAFTWPPVIDNYSITDCDGVLQPSTLITSTGTPDIVVNVVNSTAGLRFGLQPHLGGPDSLNPTILHIKFDGDVDDNSNLVSTNITTNNNVTFVGGPSTDFSQAGNFAAGGGSITINASPTMNSATFQMPIEAWINPAATTPQPLFEYNNDVDKIGPHLWISSPGASPSSNGSLFANLVDTDTIDHIVQSPPGIVQAGVWQHVALTYSGSVARLYHDGVLVASRTLGSFLPMETGVTAHIGWRSTWPATVPLGPWEFVGRMDELRLIILPLSATAISNDEFGGILRISTTGLTGNFTRIKISTLAGAGTYFPSPPTNPYLLTTTVTLAAIPFDPDGNNIMDLSFQDQGGSTSRIFQGISVNVTPPTTPGNVTPTPLDTARIRWDWQKPTRLCLLNVVGPVYGRYNLYDGASPFTLVVGDIANTLTTTEAGFTPNQKVERQMTAFDAYGESPKTGVVLAYTHANPPTAAGATDISTGSMILTWNGNGNP